MEDTELSEDPIRAYVQRVLERLTSNGYRAVTTDVAPYLVVGEKSGFQLTKFGNVDISIHVGLLREATSERLAAFSAAAFAAAAATPRGFRLPNGFGNAMFSHALAIVESAPPELVAYVAGRVPPKHWSAFESLAMFDIAAGTLHVFTGTPLLGAAYFAGTRKVQQQLFS